MSTDDITEGSHERMMPISMNVSVSAFTSLNSGNTKCSRADYPLIMGKMSPARSQMTASAYQRKIWSVSSSASMSSIKEDLAKKAALDWD